MRLNLFIIYCLLFLVSIGWTQQVSEFEFNNGLNLVQQGRLYDAYRYFRNLNKEYPDDIRVMRVLGEIEAKRERWKGVEDWMADVIKEAPDDILAAYYLAISHREQGKYKAFIMRNREWLKSARYFEQVIEIAPAFRDVQFEYARLHCYRDDYEEAIHYARRQLQTGAQTDFYVGLASFYYFFVHNKPDDYLQWSENAADVTERFYRAEVFRLAEKFDRADSIQTAIADSMELHPFRVPYLIARAQTQYSLERPNQALAFFHKALDSVQTDIDAALMFDHMKFIMSDAELNQYKKLRLSSQKQMFFKKMWVQRDPMPSSDTNYRILEHLRRVNYAEQEYFYDGFNTEFSNPDKLHYISFPNIFELNDRYNDKGVVYIRHGQPDEVAFNVHQAIDTNESWLYYAGGAVHEKIMFHFLQGETQAGNNWRLVAFLPREMMEARIHWDPLYARAMTAEPLEVMTIERQAAVKSSRLTELGLNMDRHSWAEEKETIVFPFYVASFRGDSERTLCEVYYSLQPDDVLDKRMDTGRRDSLHVGMAVFDMDYNLIVEKTRTVPIAEIVQGSKKYGFWPDVFSFYVEPGRYQLSLNVITGNEKGIGGFKFKYTPGDYLEPQLQMSSLELAAGIEIAPDAQGPFVKNGLKVIPMPKKYFDRDNPIHVYFEIYNLPYTDERLPFELTYNVRLLEERENNIFQQIGNLLSRRQPLTSNQVERYADSNTSIEYISLDLNKNDPGLYEMEVVASIPSTSDTTSKTIKFELR